MAMPYSAIRNRLKKQITGKLRWTVHTVAFDEPAPKQIDFEIEGGKVEQFTYEISTSVAGFVDVECAIPLVENGRPMSKRTRFGALPTQVVVPLTKENDFDSFWKKSLAELAKVDPDFSIKPTTNHESSDIELFEVTMTSFGDVHVRGWLEVPKSKGPHPIVVRVPGYGANMKPINKWDDIVVFSFNPRGHGNSQDEVPHDPVDYWIRGLEDKNEYYYRGA